MSVAVPLSGREERGGQVVFFFFFWRPPPHQLLLLSCPLGITVRIIGGLRTAGTESGILKELLVLTCQMQKSIFKRNSAPVSPPPHDSAVFPLKPPGGDHGWRGASAELQTGACTEADT